MPEGAPLAGRGTRAEKPATEFHRVEFSEAPPERRAHRDHNVRPIFERDDYLRPQGVEMLVSVSGVNFRPEPAGSSAAPPLCPPVECMSGSMATCGPSCRPPDAPEGIAPYLSG